MDYDKKQLGDWFRLKKYRYNNKLKTEANKSCNDGDLEPARIFSVPMKTIH
jgi:hypothetical protein